MRNASYSTPCVWLTENATTLSCPSGFSTLVTHGEAIHCVYPDRPLRTAASLALATCQTNGWPLRVTVKLPSAAASATDNTANALSPAFCGVAKCTVHAGVLVVTALVPDAPGSAAT